MSACRWMVLTLFILTTPVAGAQREWPAFMPRLRPAASESSVPAVLPLGGNPLPPNPALPFEHARWHGSWRGWACAGLQCDVRIDVEQVSAQAATVAFASANPLTGLQAERVTGAFVNGELTVPLSSGERLVMRLRDDGDMEMALWRAEKQLVSVGVLTQKPIQQVYTRTTERLPTPWMADGQAQALELVVYRPLGRGPFPTLVLNHGSTGAGTRPAWFTLTWTSPDLARFFASHGWQVLFPQRRGRGQSDGLYDEGFSADRSQGYACEPTRALAGFDRAMADLDVVMPQILARPDVDGRRAMIGGVSRGGILAVAYAGAHPDMFVGVLNLVGGWVGDRCQQADAINPVSMRRGAGFKRPMLWLYGEQDPYYTLAHSRANHEAFKAAGGQGAFLAFQPAPGRDGHSLHNEPGVWQSAVEDYLAEMGRH